MRILALSALSTSLFVAQALSAPASASAQPAAPQPSAPTAAAPTAAPGAAAPAADSPKKDDPDSSALKVPETPPQPPAAGTPGKEAAAPAAVPKAFPDEAALALRDPATGEPIAGWHNFFFIRDPDGNFRISPTGEVQLDFNAWAGPNVDAVPTVNGGTGLHPRFFAKKLRFGMHGEFLKRWSFLAAFDLTQGISNGSGTEEAAAAPAGADPTSDSARFRPVQGVDAGVGMRDIWINYSLCPCLNFQIGQFQPPVTQENRTSDAMVPLMERSLATRTFVVPGQRETGLMLWGDFGDDMFTYELAVVGGDGQNRATVDAAPDFMGRLLLAPFKSIKLVKDVRFGVGGRHGQRDSKAVGYDVVPFSTSNGYVLWDSVYKNADGQRVHVMPSGAQNTIGGEFLLPIGPVDIAGQAYYNAYHTREGLEGFQLTNTERLGTLSGLGLTTWVTWWIFGDERIGSAIGRNKPSKLNLKKKADFKRGLEVDALFSAIVASYDGNSRGGEDDEKTPGSAGNPATDINVYQFAGAVSYWHTRSVRMSFNYAAYLTPGSGSEDNLAKIPGNTGAEPDPDAHVLHEFGTRVQLVY